MRVTNRGAAEPIKNRVNFTGNSMSGRWTDSTSYGKMQSHTGRELFRSMMNEHIRQGKRMFVVYSYETPMAWYSPLQQRWYYVDESYSVTTSKHQHIIRMAIDTWDGNQWLNEYVEVS